MKHIVILIVSTFFIFSCMDKKNNSTNVAKESRVIKTAEKPLYDPNDKILKATLDFEEKNGKIYFIGTTNLPSNTKLGIEVANKNGYTSQDYKIFVNDFHFESSGFSSQKNPLVGSYEVKLFTYFNKSWQKKVDIEILEEYTGQLIKETEDEIFGKYNQFEISKQLTFGTKAEVGKKNEACDQTLKDYEKIYKKIDEKLLTLENLFKKSSKENFNIEIGKWNRESRAWQRSVKVKMTNDCCNTGKRGLLLALTNFSLLESEYAFAHDDGGKDIDNFKKKVKSNLKVVKVAITKCKK